jgi:NAD(P)-dependent dehydrogenase (short-subunit alcohol dehydrogenase family)
MRLLILGGTVFLGRHVAAEALARGHEVTLLHRRHHGSELFPGVERLLADRTADLSMLDAAVAATGSGARLTWVPDDALLGAGAQPWDDLPLWLPEAEAHAAWRVDTTRARGAGLRCRPVAETIADVWSWLCAGGDQELGDWRAEHRPSRLSAEDERELLAAAAGAR